MSPWCQEDVLLGSLDDLSHYGPQTEVIVLVLLLCALRDVWAQGKEETVRMLVRPQCEAFELSSGWTEIWNGTV